VSLLKAVVEENECDGDIHPSTKILPLLPQSVGIYSGLTNVFWITFDVNCSVNKMSRNVSTVLTVVCPELGLLHVQGR
jgi:hypothetical protein